LKSLAREPLVRFPTIGLVLFVSFQIVAPKSDKLDSKTVDAAA